MNHILKYLLLLMFSNIHINLENQLRKEKSSKISNQYLQYSRSHFYEDIACLRRISQLLGRLIVYVLTWLATAIITRMRKGCCELME